MLAGGKEPLQQESSGSVSPGNVSCAGSASRAHCTAAALGGFPRCAPAASCQLRQLQPLNGLEKLPESQCGLQGHKSPQDLVDQRGIITRDWEMGANVAAQVFLRLQGEVEHRELSGESLAGDAAHISGLLRFLAPFLIILALITLEFGPDSFCHQCQARGGQEKGKVCTL